MPSHPQAVVIGASAGALEALSSILPKLPKGFGLPIMVVVHVPPGKRSILAELFQAKCRVPVREVDDKEPIVSGTVYFAPPDYHLLVENETSLSLSSDEAVLFSRPSIDVLFESAADAYGAGLVGIVLTGANHDGAKGLRAILDARGTALVQDPATALAAAMPEGALRMSPGARIASLDEIAAYLVEVGRRS
ncbi:chemotaxis protein CheB [Aureimonas sp. ME7]|uniref:chemotaxis protein CheB n=1 Tax=Aureimonas sp. ME7 TaxID=2744252 RepID=UPI0015F98A16|nr:chemotaxis protein CheB [Aureimonas sp. ME7]